jgi:4-hydroxybenzoate polyprenyltransferase
MAPGAAPADAAKGNLVDRHAPAAARPYLRLARIDRPIGWWLLLLPCWWSTALAAIMTGRAPDPVLLVLFFIGAVAMRGAGSTWNDIVDRELDRSVARTQNRPLAARQVSVVQAAIFAAGLSFIGLLVLVSLNPTAIIVGLCSLLPVAIYPFMKRVTHYPQFVLGLAFAWGALMGFAAVMASLPPAAFALYAGTIAWVIGYDTIYALQDLEDDAIVGIGSTARRFGDRAPAFVTVCYALALALIGLGVALAGGGWIAFGGVFAFAAHLAWQSTRIVVSDGALALFLFKSNRDAGLILFAGLALDALL